VKMNTEIGHLVDIAVHTQLDQFRQVLDEHGISANLKDSILSSMKGRDDHVRQTFELFKTAKRTENYLKKNFHYVPPTTVKLGNGTFQYVSIVETLKQIESDKTYQRMKKQRNSHYGSPGEGFLLEDIEDGLLLKENKFFRRHPNAMRKGNVLYILCPASLHTTLPRTMRIFPTYRTCFPGQFEFSGIVCN
jgi:hypothetical protein